MIASATDMGITVQDLAEKNIAAYLEEMDALNVKRAEIYPRATEEIPKIQEIIGGLIDKDYAYAVQGDVYYRVRKKKDYGKLGHRTLDTMRVGARIEPGELKNDPLDFALWKAEKPGEPSWDSPWGKGRPGWHIECSAMSLAYLGETLDIHGGGQDLVFPHHENEIAQTEAFNDGKPMAQFWVHNGLLRLGEDKMSKSLGNFITVKEALSKFSTDALRLFFLSSHYRSPLSYTNENVLTQERALERIRIALKDSPSSGPSLTTESYKKRFDEAMEEDLNTPRALAVIFDLCRDINRARDEGGAVAEAQEILLTLGRVLGLTFANSDDSQNIEAAPFIDLLINIRKELREAKQFAVADSIRDNLADLGVTLEDSAEGTKWRRR
jgi:cysteinyl-tRNA synthetase